MLLPGRHHRGRERPVVVVLVGARSVGELASFPKNVLTLVPPTKMPPRAPFGPSVALIAGIFFSGIALVLQKSAAVSRDTLQIGSVPYPASTGKRSESVRPDTPSPVESTAPASFERRFWYP